MAPECSPLGVLCDERSAIGSRAGARDGRGIDQIVLSPQRYLQLAPVRRRTTNHSAALIWQLAQQRGEPRSARRLLLSISYLDGNVCEEIVGAGAVVCSPRRRHSSA